MLLSKTCHVYGGELFTFFLFLRTHLSFLAANDKIAVFYYLPWDFQTAGLKPAVIDAAAVVNVLPQKKRGLVSFLKVTTTLV